MNSIRLCIAVFGLLLAVSCATTNDTTTLTTQKDRFSYSMGYDAAGTNKFHPVIGKNNEMYMKGFIDGQAWSGPVSDKLSKDADTFIRERNRLHDSPGSTIPEKSQQEISDLNYAAGYYWGYQAKHEQRFDIDPVLFSRGFTDYLTGKKMLLTQKEAASAFMDEIHREVLKSRDRTYKENEKLREKNKAEGEAYLAENAKKPGVRITPSGLQYRVITMGTGEKPLWGDTVTVKYRGTTVNGELLDSSPSLGKKDGIDLVSSRTPFPAWGEALTMMPVGSRFEFVIPSLLAYGDGPTQHYVGPCAVLIYDIELIDFRKGPKRGEKETP